MTDYADVAIEEFFDLVQGKPRHTLARIEADPGSYPVYSASLLAPFGFISTADHHGPLLTWVMNGYAGRVQEVSGAFSATRDRGIMLPKPDVLTPDLTYVRFAAEPQLVAASVGRVVEGRRNNYTKLYPGDAGKVSFPVPLSSDGEYDYTAMTAIGERLRRIEAARSAVASASDQVTRAVVAIEDPEISKTVSLADEDLFSTSIGDRVLTSEHVEAGVPVFSANPRVPFGYVSKSNLSDFSKPSILWGIDGNFDVSFVQSGVTFATTDHCGRLQVLKEDIDPEYVYWYLYSTKEQYGFDRVFRASLSNIRAEVEVDIPVDSNDNFDLSAQRAMATRMRELHVGLSGVNSALNELMRRRVQVEEMSA